MDQAINRGDEAPVGRRAKAAVNVPLVVDLDGTLIKTGFLQEAVAQLLARQAIPALRALLTLSQGRTAFKAAVAEHILLDVGTVPVDETVLEAMALGCPLLDRAKCRRLARFCHLKQKVGLSWLRSRKAKAASQKRPNAIKPQALMES